MEDLKLSMKKIDYKILVTMRKEKKMTRYESVTKKEICKMCDVSIARVSIAVKLLLRLGYIDYGIPNGAAKTYYLTEEGKEDLVETCFKGQIKIKDSEMEG